MNNRRIIIHPEIFIWTSLSNGLVYDSKKQRGCRFENNKTISDFIKILHQPESLYSAIIPSNIDSDIDFQFKFFIELLLKNNFATLIDDRDDVPLSIKPILKIQDDVSYYRWLNKQGIDGSIIDNLHKIIVNLGSINGLQLFACQSPFPTYFNSSINIIREIKQFIINSRQSSFLSEINIIGNPINKL